MIGHFTDGRGAVFNGAPLIIDALIHTVPSLQCRLLPVTHWPVSAPVEGPAVTAVQCSLYVIVMNK